MKLHIRVTALLFFVLTLVSHAFAVPVPLADLDMETPGREAWKTYGTPTRIEKVTQAHSGKQALQVETDNQDIMGGGFEGIERELGEFQTGDRVRVSFWMRPLAGQAIWVGMGRSSFEQIWSFVNTDWMEAVCDFRVRASGMHSIWITQASAPNKWQLDDFKVQKLNRLDLGAAPAAEQAALKSERARLWLSRKTGALCGIENKQTGEILAPRGQQQPLFSLDLTNADGSSEQVGFDEFSLQSCRATKEKVSLEFAARGRPIRVTCTVTSNNTGTFDFTGSIHNNSDARILGWTYPIVQGVRPAGDAKNLTMVHPDQTGQIEHDALKSQGLDATYPGRAVMGWFDISGERGGLALLSRDTTRTGTHLSALPAPGDTFDCALTKEVVIAPKSNWNMPVHSLLLHAGDWHSAADNYRTWARGWLGTPNIPRWIRDADGWILIGLQNNIPFWQIPDLYRQGQWMGTEFMNVHGEGIDSIAFDEAGNRIARDMTFVYPNPRFGTPDDLKRAVKDVHDRDGRVLFYMLYERWTPSHETSQDLGSGPRSIVPSKYFPPANFYRDNALVERAGAEPPSDNAQFAVRQMCMAAPGWQEWQRRWAIDVYTKEYGADGFYWDVMGRTGPFRCFNAHHNHHGENLWAQGVADLMAKVHKEGRALNPDYSSAIEGTQDALLPDVGFHLMSGATKTPEVMRYTFPELCLVDGFSNHYWQWTQPEKARRVWLNGERFDLHGYQAQVRRFVWLRKRLKPFIDWPARFVDTVGLTVSDPRVEARRFVRDDGGNRVTLITMMNESGAEKVLCTTKLSSHDAIRTANLFTLDGAIRPLEIVKQEGDTVSFYAPTNEVSGALFVQNVDAALQIVPTLEQIQTPGTDGIELTLFYPLGKSTAPKVQFTAENDVPLEALPPRAGESSAVEHLRWQPRGGLNALRDWTKMTAAVKWAGGEAWVWSLLCPLVVNGDFETLRPTGQLVSWPNLPNSENAASGKHSLKLENPDDKFVYATALTPLKPATRYRLRAKIKRDTAGSDARVALVEYEDMTKFQMSAVIGAGGKAGEWEQFETTFTSHPDPRSSGIYLYAGKEKNVWFDDIELQEITNETAP